MYSQLHFYSQVMRKTLLNVFKDHLFPDNKDSVIVSEDKLAFQQIASALSSAELMKVCVFTSITIFTLR